MPLIFGFGGFGAFVNWRSRSRKVSFLDGFLGWCILLITGFAGELLAHVIYPSAYRKIGDNPAMVAGLVITITLSLFLCPIMWWNVRRK